MSLGLDDGPPPVDQILVRAARREDLQAIVGLHQDDALGGHGDHWSETTRPLYEAAFAAILRSSESRLYVALLAGAVVGTFQVTVTPGLNGRGALRATLEGVQVRADQRSRGIGAAMLDFAEQDARSRGAASLALTSNKRRSEAHRFYERLGYARSHEGFRKAL